ncbi:hypothetical protein F5884DRAFT_757731 [Xylogone sp. PMI_703]|nr:hypothetical protein F5884DRAFT_757731 [Xylogone sp. PMI_703]
MSSRPLLATILDACDSGSADLEHFISTADSAFHSFCITFQISGYISVFSFSQNLIPPSLLYTSPRLEASSTSTVKRDSSFSSVPQPVTEVQPIVMQSSRSARHSSTTLSKRESLLESPELGKEPSYNVLRRKPPSISMYSGSDRATMSSSSIPISQLQMSSKYSSTNTPLRWEETYYELLSKMSEPLPITPLPEVHPNLDQYKARSEVRPPINTRHSLKPRKSSTQDLPRPNSPFAGALSGGTNSPDNRHNLTLLEPASRSRQGQPASYHLPSRANSLHRFRHSDAEKSTARSSLAHEGAAVISPSKNSFTKRHNNMLSTIVEGVSPVLSSVPEKREHGPQLPKNTRSSIPLQPTRYRRQQSPRTPLQDPLSFPRLQQRDKQPPRISLPPPRLPTFQNLDTSISNTQTKFRQFKIAETASGIPQVEYRRKTPTKGSRTYVGNEEYGDFISKISNNARGLGRYRGNNISGGSQLVEWLPSNNLLSIEQMGSTTCASGDDTSVKSSLRQDIPTEQMLWDSTTPTKPPKVKSTVRAPRYRHLDDSSENFAPDSSHIFYGSTQRWNTSTATAALNLPKQSMSTSVTPAAILKENIFIDESKMHPEAGVEQGLINRPTSPHKLALPPSQSTTSKIEAESSSTTVAVKKPSVEVPPWCTMSDSSYVQKQVDPTYSPKEQSSLEDAAVTSTPPESIKVENPAVEPNCNKVEATVCCSQLGQVGRTFEAVSETPAETLSKFFSGGTSAFEPLIEPMKLCGQCITPGCSLSNQSILEPVALTLDSQTVASSEVVHSKHTSSHSKAEDSAADQDHFLLIKKGSIQLRKSLSLAKRVFGLRESKK